MNTFFAFLRGWWDMCFFFYLLKFLMIMLLDYYFFFTLVGTLNQIQIKYTFTFWREVNLNSHLWNETQAPASSICWLKYHKHIIFCWKCCKSSSFFHLNFMMNLISSLSFFFKPSYLATAVHQLGAHARGTNQIMKYGGGRRGHRQTRPVFFFFCKKQTNNKTNARKQIRL